METCRYVFHPHVQPPALGGETGTPAGELPDVGGVLCGVAPGCGAEFPFAASCVAAPWGAEPPLAAASPAPAPCPAASGAGALCWAAPGETPPCWAAPSGTVSCGAAGCDEGGFSGGLPVRCRNSAIQLVTGRSSPVNSLYRSKALRAFSGS